MCRRGPSLSSPSALPTYGWGSWDQSLLTSSKTSLLTVQAVVGGDTDAFMVGKHLKGPVTRACMRPAPAPSPLLFFFVLSLLTPLLEGTCVSPSSPPCALAGEDGAAEAPGSLSRATPKPEARKAVGSKPVVGRGSCDPSLLQRCASQWRGSPSPSPWCPTVPDPTGDPGMTVLKLLCSCSELCSGA